MGMAMSAQITAALAEFSGKTRLYELNLDSDAGRNGTSEWLVEAFAADDALQGIVARDVIALSTSAHVALKSLLGEAASLAISLADGTRASFAGVISEAAMLGSDGGLTRHRIRISPWMWQLAQVRNSWVWQDKTVIEIVDSVFAAYQPLAKWRWSDETGPFLADAMRRSYCCQYRESDLDFVRRILTEEGLCWRFEQAESGPGVVLFADSSNPDAIPEDISSAAEGSVRYHGARSSERSDTVQALIVQRRLHASLVTVLASDYKSKQAVAAGSPSHVWSGKHLPLLESFDVPGQYAHANRQQAQHYADLRMEALEARGQVWRGRSTVRTLRAGTRMTVSGMPIGRRGSPAAFTLVRVTSIGVNNLPPPARQALAELFGPISELLEEIVCGDDSEELALAMAQARESGYANCFEAIPSDLPWRPELPGGEGSQRNPSAHCSQTAIVIGADGADELYCDRLGRVRIRFHWQDSGAASCWVRVAQRSAGGGMGSQFLPRIGQEVLVQFLENDIDRPIIVGTLYNGRGEGGVAPTPGGHVSSTSDLSCFQRAHDHAPSGQGNLAGGNSPVWHGASGDSAGHRNAAAQWGVRSKEFGGFGYNQLLFDDTDGQGRIQLKSSCAATELNLGHLIHAADNYRGSFRGLGAELRTDAYGALRAGAGLLVTSYRSQHSASSRDPAGENTGGASLLEQACALGEAFHPAAQTHQAVGLATHLGTANAKSSALDDKAAPLPALLTALSGMVESGSLDAAGADARVKSTSAAGGKLPHFTDPVIAIAAQGGFGACASQSLQLANGETVTLMSGQDTQFVSGGQMRVQSGQAIGLLAGAVKAGEDGIGLQLIAAKDAIEMQAQADELKVQARDEIDVISANAHIDWAAAKRISLSKAGGANITIEGGNITVQCPGKIKVHAGKKSFVGPARLSYPMPALPGSICVECLKKALSAGSAFSLVE